MHSCCVQLQQKVMTTAVVASMLVNVGTVLSVSAMTFAASASFVAAGFSGVGVLANWIKVGPTPNAARRCTLTLSSCQ